MSKKIRLFLDILSVTGIFAWVIVMMPGVYYASGCSWAVSVPVSLGCGLLMGFFLYTARYFSRPKESNDFSVSGVVRKWLFFGLYAVVGLVSAWWVLHTVAVASTLRDSIQPAARVQLAELRTMINPATGSGAAKGSYMEFVESRLANYRNYNPNNRTESDELDADLRNLKDLLVATSGYPMLSAEIKDFGERASYAVDNWDLFTVGSYVDELARQKPIWEKRLAECSRNANTDMFAMLHTEYAPLDTHDTRLAYGIFHPSWANVSFGGVALVLLMQIVILSSWVAVSVDKVRSPKGVGENNFITTWK